MHFNLGTWKGVRAIPPKVQVIWWFPAWKGLRWHQWEGGIASILRGSLVLGWLELRFWRRPKLTTKVEYPDRSTQRDNEPTHQQEQQTR